MKCPICNGTGIEKIYDKRTNAYLNIPCATCHETGHINETGNINQTNEEWFCFLSTEEKVKALLDLRERIRQKMRAELGSENKFHKGDYYREWLKEKHNA